MLADPRAPMTQLPTVSLSVFVALAAALATRVRLLPEVVDPSIVLTCSGLGALAFSAYGALRRFDPDRVARLALGGTLLGAAFGALLFVGLLVRAVLW